MYGRRCRYPHDIYPDSCMAVSLGLVLSRPRWIDTTVSFLTCFLKQDFFLNGPEKNWRDSYYTLEKIIYFWALACGLEASLRMFLCHSTCKDVIR